MTTSSASGCSASEHQQSQCLLFDTDIPQLQFTGDLYPGAAEVESLRYPVERTTDTQRAGLQDHRVMAPPDSHATTVTAPTADPASFEQFVKTAKRQTQPSHQSESSVRRLLLRPGLRLFRGFAFVRVKTI